MQSYGLYTVVLHEEFSWSMTVLSGAFALTRVESGLLGPLQGWLVDRYGPRIILTVGLVMFGIGFLFAFANRLATFLLPHCVCYLSWGQSRWIPHVDGFDRQLVSKA